MVARQSQEVQFNQAPTPQAQNSNMGAARVDADKFGKSYDISSGRADVSSDRLLSSILEVGGKLANQLADRSIEEAYLDGVAKAGTVKEESDLQGNPLTKDWQTAGFRDTVGKLAAADREAQIALDMKRLREQPPEKFNEYLTASRQEFLPKLEGMSFEQRKSMFAQQVFSERAAIKKHSAEHYSFVMEEKNKVLNAGYNRMEEAMNLSKKDSPDGDARASYKASVDNAFAFARGVFADTSLPESTRSTLLSQFAARAIESGNMDLYTAITNKTVDYPDGSKRPMSDNIPYEDRLKLSKAYSAAMTKTAGLRAQNYIAELVDVRGRFNNPDAQMPTHGEVVALLNKGMQEHPEYVTESRYGEVLDDWQKAGLKRQNEQGVANAFQTGDVGALYKLTKGNIGEGLSTWSRVVGSKLPVVEATRQLARIGLDTGQMEAFAEMGKLSKAGWAAMSSNNGVPDPAHAQMVESTMNFFDAATAKHMDGALSQYLTAFSPEERSFILDVKANYANGLKGEAAYGKARDKMVEDSKLSAPMRNALQSKANTENVQLLDDFKPQGPLDQIYNAVVGISPWGGNAAADKSIQLQKGLLGQAGEFFSGGKAVDMLQAQVGITARETLESVTRENPTANAAKRLELTKAKMQERVVSVKGVPFFVPMGQTPSTFFGVKADPRTIADALAAEAKASDPKNSVSFNVDRLGRLTATEYTKDGGYARQPWVVDVPSIRTRIEATDRQARSEFDAQAGRGVTKTMKGANGPVSVTYNGENTANVSNASMLEFRSNLVKFERVTDRTYPDGSGGRTSVGVGVNSGNDHYPKLDASGVATPDQINTSFIRASDDAARLAAKAMTATRVVNDASFKLWADLAYQAGGQVVQANAYKPLRDAMARRDVQAAQQALEGTLAWKYGKGERQDYRRKLLIEALKG